MKAAIALFSLAVSGAAFAGQSTPFEMNGYNTCKKAIDVEHRGEGVMYKPFYYLNTEETQRTYYINASVWADGEREALRAECVTNRAGHKLVSLQTQFGQFTNGDQPRVSVEVAAN